MGKPGAFLTLQRETHTARPVKERVRDFDPLYRELDDEGHRRQASRCMMCGVAFCQAGHAFGPARPSGCPLHNLIPEWNDLVWRGLWDEAAARLAITSPLPEFTSRVCPALCEAACNLGSLEDEPTAIHDTERAISDYEWAHGGPRRFEPAQPDAPRVGIVGSGPAGLAAAWELARRGARATVYERADRPGGLLMYGIPNMKLEKSVVERRVALMRELGIAFELGVDASDPHVADAIRAASDAVIIAAGAREARRLSVPGSDAAGVVLAVDYLEDATRALLDAATPSTTAAGKDVVIIGGGDTGNDCAGTAVRQGARSVRQLEIMPEPSRERTASNPWPQWPQVKKTDYGQQEAIALMGGEMRRWSTDTLRVETDGQGNVCGITVARVAWNDGRPERVPGTEETLPAQLVLVACGFTGPEADVLDALGVASTGADRCRRRPAMRNGGYACEPNDAADGPAMFACGDARTGSSLVVSAIADAMACADAVAKELCL